LPGRVGDGEQPVVEHGDEAGRTAARRDVGAALGVRARDEREAAQRQVVPAVHVQVVDRLVGHELDGGS
jgi:hypothetical protein